MNSTLLHRPPTTGLLACMVLASIAVFCARSQAAGVELSVTNLGNEVEVAWISSSVSASAPFLHYEFQVQVSSNLAHWDNLGALIPGGALSTASIPHSVQVPTDSRASFVRATFRFNMPGADLSGMDLRGADLRGANLAGANLAGTRLEGALLGGADLTGADLAGATLTGANFQDVNLDGFDLTGLDLSGIQGTPRLTLLTANPDADAAQLLPTLPYFPDPLDFVSNEPDLPGTLSKRNAMMMLKRGATVAQFNSLLARHGAAIVASSPASPAVGNGHLMLRFPTATALALYHLTLTLRQDEIVSASAPDVAMGPTVVPNDENGATSGLTGWRWNNGLFGGTGGNWGWEKARVPQAWNLKTAFEKRGVSPIPTCILDVRFAEHDDLKYTISARSASLANPAALTNLTDGDHHGNQVSGIVGATYGNTNGIDGVNPFAELIPMDHTHRVTADAPDPAKGLTGKSLTGYDFVQDVAYIITNFPAVKIINVSLGFNWTLKDGNYVPLNELQLTNALHIAQQYGMEMKDKLAMLPSAQSVLIVTGAGNDHGLSARISSPLCNAAIELGVQNILVVESHGRLGSRSGFSNIDGHVAAPGEGILSTSVLSDEYRAADGTSYAAPFAAGLAGYLMAAKPDLDPPRLIDLLTRNGANIDAFTSVMEIDTLGTANPMLQMLLDIDDGTYEGSTRLNVPTPTPDRDRSFDPVLQGVLNREDVQGDGSINMADFRRWRDWFLFGDGNHSLNGGNDHPKNDANGDGRVDRSEEANVYPRGDFNGNGKSQRSQRSEVPGALENLNLTDLEVLINSGLWNDFQYFSHQLPDLIDSFDIMVFADNFFVKNTDYDIPGGIVQIYDADSRQPVSFGGPVELSLANSFQLFTVPTGQKYYAASQPIDVGDGTNILMRSIGDFNAHQQDRGGDFAVDLTLVEMTAVADVLNPELHEIDSQPNEEEVDAYLPAVGGWTEKESVGARAWSNDEGTLYALANAGSPEVEPPDPAQGTTFSAGVRWQRSFIKDENLADPTFKVKPMRLHLVGRGPMDTELDAFAEIIIEMRAFGVSPEWQPVFTNCARITGKAKTDGTPATFRIVEAGKLPTKKFIADDVSMEYVQEKYKGTIDLDHVPNGQSFEVRYRLFAKVIGNGADNLALAYVGDPLDYGSGTRTEYGSFGELPRITSYREDGMGTGHVGYVSKINYLVSAGRWTNFYYLLYRGGDGDTTGLPIAIKLAQGGFEEMSDPTPPLDAGVNSYTLENRPLSQPLDVDDDMIDDAFELLHPDILDPLDSSDALEDADGDGRSNLREYLDGTDPMVVDGGPAQLYPGLIIAASGDQVGDINNDGIVDLIGFMAGSGLDVSLGQADTSFLVPTHSPVPSAGIISAYTLGKVNGDAFLDALIVDRSANSLRVMLGDGAGSFTAGQQYSAGNRPSRVIGGDLNNDTFLDAVLVNDSGWTVTVLLGNGDGTFQAPINTDTIFTPYDVAVAKMDADSLPDLAVTLANHKVAVFPGNGDGTFGAKQEFTTGFSPRRVAAADLNNDGFTDVVTANQTSDGVSVLLGNGDGTLQARVDYATGDNPRDFRIADIDNDADPDLVIGHFGAAYHAILLNSGTGVFAVQTPAFTHNGGSCLLADFDRDGRLDLMSTPSGNAAFLSLGLPGGRFDTRADVIIPLMSPADLELADINGDGFTDALIANQQSNTVEVVMGSAGGAFAHSRTIPVWPQTVGLAVAKLDAGNTMDLAVVTQRRSFSPGTSSNELHILIGDGTGSFLPQTVYPLNDVPRDVLVGDLNGDGRTDLVVMPAITNHAIPFIGQADGSLLAAHALDLGGSAFNYELRDLNGDGRADLVAAPFIAGSGNVLRVYLAGTDGTLAQIQQLPDSVADFTFHDFTGDGRLDLVATTGTRLVYYPANTDGTFGSETTILNDMNSSRVEIADVNGDGLADVLGGGTIWLARAGGGFENSQTYFLGGALPLRVQDLNGDNKLDLIGTDDFSDALQLIFHR